MTLKQALVTLAANATAASPTFIYWLHERNTFDRAGFWALFDAMTVIARAAPKARGRTAAPNALHVYIYILRCIVRHFDSHDRTAIRRLPGRNLSSYLDRLEWAFAPVIAGRSGYGQQPDFGDDLKNPPQQAPNGRSRHARKRRTA
jgi:hypothetical protein